MPESVFIQLHLDMACWEIWLCDDQPHSDYSGESVNPSTAREPVYKKKRVTISAPETNIFLRIEHPNDTICIAEMVATHNGRRKTQLQNMHGIQKYFNMSLLTRNTACSNHVCNWVYMSSKTRKYSAFTIKCHPPHPISLFIAHCFRP